MVPLALNGLSSLKPKTFPRPTDLFNHLPPSHPTGNTKDKIISELDKIQLEVNEHIEGSRDRLDGMDRDVRRFESTLVVEMGDCRRSGDGLEKRLSKLEGVCSRMDGVSDSLQRIKDGTSPRLLRLIVYLVHFGSENMCLGLGRPLLSIKWSLSFSVWV